MNAPIIYLADPTTAEFIGISYADPDPLTPGGWLRPAHSYLDAPPSAPAGMVAVRVGDDWDLTPDYRGTVYRTDTGVPAEHASLGALPDGLTSQPRPSQDHAWTGEAWEVDADLAAENASVARIALQRAIDIERDRRISAGFVFGGITYQSRLPDGERSGDWEVFSGKALEALIAVIGGVQPGDLRWSDPAEDFAWIAADNSRVPMDAQTVIELGKAASAHRSAHTFAGSDLKAMDSIPGDYTDDKWWP